ncbi:hypothetical protein PT2222_530002 [Paraburkholderia tropica]
MHPTIMVTRFHNIPLTYNEHPVKYLFMATCTGLAGVGALLWGSWRLIQSVFERPW